MGEAIFAKYSKSSINSSSLVSNETKAGLGLGPNATLDDCFKTLSYKSDSMGTVIVTVKDIDGSVVSNTDVHMNVPAGAGANLIYKTNANGQCIFKTNAGTANFSDHAYDNYIDVSGKLNERVDCPVGTVKYITLQRYKCFSNGGVVGNFTSNRTVNFSKWANTVDVTVKGEDGQGGHSSSVIRMSFGQLRFPVKGSTIIVTNLIHENNSINNCGLRIFPSADWTNQYNPPPPNFYYTSSLVSNCINVRANPITTGLNNYYLNIPGCNGLAGEIKTQKGISISSQSKSIIIYKSTKSYNGYHQFYNSITNTNIPYSALSLDTTVRSISSTIYNTNGGMSITLGNNFYYDFSTTPFIRNNGRSNGATGASASAFGITASGGIGGYTIPVIVQNYTNSNTQFMNSYNNHKNNDIGGGKGGTLTYIQGTINFTNYNMKIRYQDSDTYENGTRYSTGYFTNLKHEGFTGNMYFQPGLEGNPGYVNIHNIQYK